MRAVDAVLETGLAVAAVAAAELGVELLEQPSVHLADRDVVKRPVQMRAGVLLVAGPGGLLDHVRAQS
jgi:hypothetical protein